MHRDVGDQFTYCSWIFISKWNIDPFVRLICHVHGVFYFVIPIRQYTVLLLLPIIREGDRHAAPHDAAGRYPISVAVTYLHRHPGIIDQVPQKCLDGGIRSEPADLAVRHRIHTGTEYKGNLCALRRSDLRYCCEGISKEILLHFKPICIRDDLSRIDGRGTGNRLKPIEYSLCRWIAVRIENAQSSCRS